MTYEIQTLTADGWSNDASLLGHGCSQADNSWATEADAIAAMAELISVGIGSAATLRVAAVQP
jgi:hypothetical protein